MLINPGKKSKPLGYLINVSEKSQVKFMRYLNGNIYEISKLKHL